jgi:hypothetical protein
VEEPVVAATLAVAAEFARLAAQHGVLIDKRSARTLELDGLWHTCIE